MDEPGIGDPAESLPGIGIVVTDRLVAEVAAGHHERGQRLRSRAGHGAEQQVVQWRVREQHADERIARRHERRQAAVVPVSHEHDRPLRAGEQLGFCRIDDGQAPGRLEIADHDGERLVAPALAHAQLGKRCRRARVARQVIATEPLDRDDRAVGQQALRTGDRRVGAVDRPGRRLEPQARPARRARDRLGVEPPITGVVILLRTRRAERERPHRRVRTVVREAAGDREPWPAVGAIDERVAVAAIGRLVQLAQAIRAHGDVGRDERATARACLALDDAEPARADHDDRLRLHRVDAGERRALGDQPSLERGHIRRVALDLDEHPVGVVADMAVEAEPCGQPVDVRPEAHALHDTTNPYPVANPRARPECRFHQARRPSVTAASRCSRPKL